MAAKDARAPAFLPSSPLSFFEIEISRMPSAAHFFSAADAEGRSGFSIWPTTLSKYLFPTFFEIWFHS